MSLIVKPPSWGHCSHNITGSPTANAGTTITAGANNADGSSAALLTNVSHDVEFLVIGFHSYNVSTGNGSTLVDILIDPAGGTTWSTDPVINDLLAGQTLGTGNALPITQWYFFPLWIKSGCSIGARARTAHTATIAGKVIAFAYGGNANPASWWCGQSVESIGINAAASQGTNHTPGNTGAFSAWANLGSTLSKPCGALQFGVQGTNTDTTQANNAYHFEFGVASTRLAVPPILRCTNTSEAGWAAPTGPIFCALPDATQLQVRGTCGGTAEALDVAAYAVM